MAKKKKPRPPNLTPRKPGTRPPRPQVDRNPRAHVKLCLGWR